MCIIKYTLCSSKYRKKNNGKGPLSHSFITTLSFQEKKNNSMRYVTDPKRPLLFIVLLCHGNLTAGQQDYSYIKFQVSQEKPLGLSIGFYFFGGTGSIACVLH